MKPASRSKSDQFDDASLAMRRVQARAEALRQAQIMLKREEKAASRKKQNEYLRAAKIALRVFARDAPDTNTAVWYYVMKWPEQVDEKGVDVLQEEIENSYLALTHPQLDEMIEHEWAGTRSILDEAARFHMDVQAYQFVEDMNTNKGIAPTYRMVHDQQEEVIKPLFSMTADHVKSSNPDAVRKSGQRFKKRMGLMMRKITARTVLPKEVLSDKVNR